MTRVVQTRLLPGFSASLAEPTALVDLECGTESLDTAAQARIRAGVAELSAREPFHGIGESDWPAAFLAPGCHEDGFGAWVVALTVALQRWAGDPVWRGRVVGGEAGRLRLAVPWRRAPLFSDALEMAVRLVDAWSRPDADTVAVRQLIEFFHDGLPAARAGGLPSGTVRFIQAALDRDIPFEVLPDWVQLGWGAGAERMDRAVTGRTGYLGASIAMNRAETSLLLGEAGLPIPRGAVVVDVDGAEQVAAELGWPVVVKSPSGPAGETVAGDAAELRRAVEAAAQRNPGAVMIEAHIEGEDHRLLVAQGTAIAADVRADVHPDNLRLAERAARILGLDICSVGIRTTDRTRSWRDTGGAVFEVECQPDLSRYWQAHPARDLNGEIIDLVFAGRSARIPVAAVAGTNGKSTTCTMLHHIWTTAGRRTGLCTTASIRVGRDVVGTDDITGLPGTRILLADPAVEAAVLEIQGWGMLHEGHPCDRYDVAALLNVQNDHLGLDGIETREQLAGIKAEVLERARDAVVVNADDPLCMGVRHRAGTDRHILVTRDSTTEAVVAHRRGGGEAVFLGERHGGTWIVYAAGDSETPVIAVNDIPATMSGLVRVNETNAMFATALAWALGVDLPTIRTALASFGNSVEQNPGRYNFIEGLPCAVLLDYAHNPDGIRELCRVVAGLPVEGRRLLCSLNIGNRHADHVAAVAPGLAELFGALVLGADPKWIKTSRDHVGDDPIAAMLSSTRQGLLDNGFRDGQITTAANPDEAVRATLAMAGPGDLVVVLAEPYDVLPVLRDVIREKAADAPS